MESNISFSNRLLIPFLFILSFLILFVPKVTFSNSDKRIDNFEARIYPQVSFLLCAGYHCQTHQIPVLSSDFNIRISTTAPILNFPQARIKVDSRFSLLGCTRLNDGSCVFSVSYQTPAVITFLS